MKKSERKNGEAESESLSLSDVLAEELERIKDKKTFNDSDPDLNTVFKKLHGAELTALCFSGGGIRSATFGLGIVQSLAKHGLLDKFDYLSTVSGGGYLGSWLSAWILRERVKIGLEKINKGRESKQSLKEGTHIEKASPESIVEEIDVDEIEADAGIRDVQERLRDALYSKGKPNPEAEELQHLREYSNYMSPRVGLLSADTWALIAIYLRNLFLNLTIFIPLIAAVLLLPRFFISAILYKNVSRGLELGTIVAALVSSAFAIAFCVSCLPSVSEERGRISSGWKNSLSEFCGKDAGVFAFGVFPLLLSAFAATCIWVWTYRSDTNLKDFDFIVINFGAGTNRSLPYFLAAAFAGFIVSTIVFLILKRFRNINLRGGLAALISGQIGAVLLWYVSQKLFVPAKLSETLLGQYGDLYEWQIFLCFAVPIFLLVVLIAATIFVGLSSKTVTDEDREWLARYGGWVLIVSCVWIVLNSLVLLGPSAIESLLAIELNRTSAIMPAIVTIIGVASGVISLFGGFSSRSQVRDEAVKTRTSKILAVAPKIAAVIFLGFIFVGIAYATTIVLIAVSRAIQNLETLNWLVSSEDVNSHAELLFDSSLPYLLIWVALLTLIGLVMAIYVNVNKFSLHGAYRDRLVRAYLGASNTDRKSNTFTGFDDGDNFQLHRLKNQRPFHIINATLNLVGGKTLAWQNRKAASFTMSPLHCGSWTLGYRNTNEYCRNSKLGSCEHIKKCNRDGKDCGTVENCRLPGKAIRLGTAMAISGAAANPNMGYYSSSVVTFLMTLFNIRLGWWLGNTGSIGSKRSWFPLDKERFFEKSSPTIAVLPLINETLGRTDESKAYLNVTDGGHFENLALYEMVLRRCRYILLSDGAADESFKFGEIANAIQKCMVDLGVDIKFVGGINIRPRTSTDGGEVTRSRFALAEIIYPEKDEKGENLTGVLLYTRPTFYGTTESTDVRNYADSNEKFPHQSTGDQMYDEKQFEAYRKLGFLTMEEIIGDREPKTISELAVMLRG